MAFRSGSAPWQSPRPLLLVGDCRFANVDRLQSAAGARTRFGTSRAHFAEPVREGAGGESIV
eukprot:2704142-Prymnesium_polylepis.1